MYEPSLRSNGKTCKTTRPVSLTKAASTMAEIKYNLFKCYEITKEARVSLNAGIKP